MDLHRNFGIIFEDILTMKKVLFICFSFLTISLQSQHSISGTFTPADQYTWVIAYRLNPGSQVYIADTAIEKGSFSLNIPQHAAPGTYRLVYAIPQEEFYFDVIYNGKEDIALSFNETDGVSYSASKENLLFSSYFNESAALEQNIIDFYIKGSTNTDKLQVITNSIKEHQTNYLEESKNLLVHHFIKANASYIPDWKETVYEYVQHKKQNYFNALELNNPILQASGYLTNKLANYVFTALPLKSMSDAETTKEIKANIDTLDNKLQGVDDVYKTYLYHSLWSQATEANQNTVADYIYGNYLKELAQVSNQEIITSIELYNRLRLGAIAPDLQWTKKGTKQTLKDLKGAENYILVFWSSTCSHCLRELPALHTELRDNADIKVIAVGLEDDAASWSRESIKMKQFEHVLALGKWESGYAKLYDVHKTPTYMILDKDKHIIAKPEDDKGVIEFLRNHP